MSRHKIDPRFEGCFRKLGIKSLRFDDDKKWTFDFNRVQLLLDIAEYGTGKEGMQFLAGEITPEFSAKFCALHPEGILSKRLFYWDFMGADSPGGTGASDVGLIWSPSVCAGLALWVDWENEGGGFICPVAELGAHPTIQLDVSEPRIPPKPEIEPTRETVQEIIRYCGKKWGRNPCVSDICNHVPNLCCAQDLYEAWSSGEDADGDNSEEAFEEIYHERPNSNEAMI